MWEIYQQARIRQANKRIAGVEATNDSRDQRRRDQIQDLEERIDRLVLVNHALWCLLRERGGLTDAHLEAEIRRLDAEDGAADGARQVLAADCANCGAKVNAKAVRCQYCGAEAPERPVFDTL